MIGVRRVAGYKGAALALASLSPTHHFLIFTPSTSTSHLFTMGPRLSIFMTSAVFFAALGVDGARVASPAAVAAGQDSILAARAAPAVANMAL